VLAEAEKKLALPVKRKAVALPGKKAMRPAAAPSRKSMKPKLPSRELAHPSLQAADRSDGNRRRAARAD